MRFPFVVVSRSLSPCSRALHGQLSDRRSFDIPADEDEVYVQFSCPE